MIVNEIKAILKIIEKNLVNEYEIILAIPITEDVMPKGDIATREYLASYPRADLESRKRNIERLISHVDSLSCKDDQFSSLCSFMECNFSLIDIYHIANWSVGLRKAFISIIPEKSFDK